MPHFHDLTVTDIRRTIRDAVVVTLEPESGDFSFVPGQYLTFRRDFDGQDVRRSYSICAGLDDGVLQVGIKRVDGGAFSTWANTELRVGDRLQAMAPQGNFHIPLAPETARHYLAFAGGSGITPILSILKTTLAHEPQSRFTLVYANQAVNTIMFRDEIEDLKNLYMGRLNVIHILEADTQEIELFTGRVDGTKCAELFRNWINISTIHTAFICGPEPMMLAISESLRTHGLNDEQIKFELFASNQPGRLPQKVAAQLSETAGHKTKARITLDGATRSLTMRRDQSILEAALENDVEAPFACRAGVCSTCRCRILEGEVEMAANHAIEDHEVADGYVLACQSYPITDQLVVSYDE